VGFSFHDLRCGSSLQVRFGGGRCPADAQGWHGQGHCQAVLAGAGPDTLETADTGRVGNPPSARWSLPSRRPQSHPMGTTLPRTHRRTSHGPPPANAQRRSPEPGWRAGPSRSLPRAAARRGTRTLASVALRLRSVRSSCMVIGVFSWRAGRQASFGLCIGASGWSVSQEDRWIADGEGMEAKFRSTGRSEDRTARLVADLRLVGNLRRSRSPDASSRRQPLGSPPIADSPSVG
jgi:hypothetical protein